MNKKITIALSLLFLSGCCTINFGDNVKIHNDKIMQDKVLKNKVIHDDKLW